MKKKVLTKQILMALAMSAAVCTTGMAMDPDPIEENYAPGQMNEAITVNNTDDERAAIKIENKGKVNVDLKTGPDAYNITLESAGSGIHTQGSTGNVVLDSSGDNVIHFGDGGNGITTSDGVNIRLKAAGDNVIESTYHIGETGENGGDGINSADGGSGSVTLDAIGSNIINVTSDGISAADDKDHTYTAHTGNNEITAGNNGINHEGSGSIKLEAVNGGNIIHAGMQECRKKELLPEPEMEFALKGRAR